MPYKNPEDAKSSRKRYRALHLEEIRERDRNRLRTRAQIIKQIETKNKRDPRIIMLAAAKCRAKKNGLEFNVTIDDITIPDICPISHITIRRNTGRGGTQHSPSLDRIDNSKGYIKGNVAVISNRANMRKSDMSLEEIERLYLYSINNKKV